MAGRYQNMTHRCRSKLKMYQVDQIHPQYSVTDDFSLLINNITDHNEGTYTIVADNGIGDTSSSDIEIIIFPILPSISMVTEKNIVKPNTDLTIECKIRGKFCYKILILTGQIP